MYVVDSADEKRLPEAFSELHTILGDERLSGVPIVIVANKQVKLGCFKCQISVALAAEQLYCYMLAVFYNFSVFTAVDGMLKSQW